MGDREGRLRLLGWVSRVRYDAIVGVLEELRAARHVAGLSQHAVAEALGTTQSAIARIESAGTSPRLSTITAYGEAVGCTIAVVSPDRIEASASALEQYVAEGDADACLRTLILLHDDLLRGRDTRQLWTEPMPCGDRRWDAALAATVELVAATLGGAVPGWTAAPSRRLDGVWFPLADILDRPLTSGLLGYLLTSAPAQFAARGVFVDAATFESC